MKARSHFFIYVWSGVLLFFVAALHGVHAAKIVPDVTKKVHGKTTKKTTIKVVRPKRVRQKQLALEIDVPQTFGKTHFIAGVPSHEVLNYVNKHHEQVAQDNPFNLVCDGCVKQVFFSPDDGVQKVLLYLIEHEKKSINVAAFSFTDGDIAAALLAAQERGVFVEIVADPGCINDKFGKMSLLVEQGIPVFIYDPHYKKNSTKGLITSIMHHKFVLFGDNVLGRTVLWTGSFNFTKSAHRQNQENVLVLDDAHVVKKYNQQFQALKERSHAPKNNNKKKQETLVAHDIIDDVRAACA